MFIDVTRHGGGRMLRVAVTAIAYLDACEGGCSLHLVGGETLRIAETPAEIEARSTPTFATAELVSEPRLTADDIVEAFARIAEAQAAPAAADPPAEGDPEKLADKRQSHRRGR